MNMLGRVLPKVFINLERRRRVCLALAPKEGALHEYLSTPLPNKDTAVGKMTILSLDFETTGLNAVQDQLLSIGCVDIANGKIKLGSGHHQVIRTLGQLKKDNVVIHKITDAEKERGAELKEAIDQLLRRQNSYWQNCKLITKACVLRCVNCYRSNCFAWVFLE